MKNILVPTDFSENSWNAIQFALEFFKDSKCNFYLLHVTPITSFFGEETTVVSSSDVIEKTYISQAKRSLHKLLKKIKNLPSKSKS